MFQLVWKNHKWAALKRTTWLESYSLGFQSSIFGQGLLASCGWVSLGSVAWCILTRHFSILLLARMWVVSVNLVDDPSWKRQGKCDLFIFLDLLAVFNTFRHGVLLDEFMEYWFAVASLLCYPTIPEGRSGILLSFPEEACIWHSRYLVPFLCFLTSVWDHW